MHFFLKCIFCTEFSVWKPGEDTKKLLLMHEHLLCNLIGLFFITVYDVCAGDIPSFDVKSETKDMYKFRRL